MTFHQALDHILNLADDHISYLNRSPFGSSSAEDEEEYDRAALELVRSHKGKIWLWDPKEGQ